MSKRIGIAILAGLSLVACLGCSEHNASDPEYGAMFKKTTQDRVHGQQFWDTSNQRDCVSGGMMMVCTPKGQNAPPGDPN